MELKEISTGKTSVRIKMWSNKFELGACAHLKHGSDKSIDVLMGEICAKAIFAFHQII